MGLQDDLRRLERLRRLGLADGLGRPTGRQRVSGYDWAGFWFFFVGLPLPVLFAHSLSR